MALLREVKYLEQQSHTSDRVLPDKAISVFQQNEVYRKYLQNLDVTVSFYNKVRMTLLDVEYPLVKDKLVDIDVQLQRAIGELCWTSSGKRGNTILIKSTYSRANFWCLLVCFYILCV